jgi:FixJ family two-component response regulator
VTRANFCVAVVDDEAAVRTALGRLLRLADYEVAAFASGDALFAWLATHVAACVILDVHMPGASGFDVHSRLRAAHVDLPAVFITASDDPALELTAREAGAAALLRKPFSNDSLLDAVDAAIRSKRGDAS